MKLHKILLLMSVVAAGFSVTSCDDDGVFEEEGKKAFILGSNENDCFKVTGNSGMTWRSRMEGTTIYILISPMVDPTVELKDVCPKFYISKGAWVEPSPEIPQDFSQEGGVQYTVTSEDGKHKTVYTVTHGITDPAEFGSGFTAGSLVVEKTFDTMGYPGQQGNFGFSDSRQYGDLNGYIAFCGHNHVVLQARQYSDPHFDNAAMNVPDASLSFKVFNVADLSEVGTLNLGSINPTTVRAMTSDWNGTLVAVTNNGGSADIYYWKSYTDAPTLLAHSSENLCSVIDGANYVQVAGDILTEANITANAPRDAVGSQYMLHLENGQITDTQIIETGYPSNDCSQYQMISPLKATANSSYLLGDTEGTAGTNYSIKVSACTYKGTAKVSMPGVLQNMWQAWWTGTGVSLSRGGARRPYVSAMYINGKYYAQIMNGTAWWWHNDIADMDDLQTRIIGTTWAFSVNCAWSFGGSCDWYWDGEESEAYCAYYVDRYGVAVFHLTCYN